MGDKRILIVAGEASGDQRAANLVREALHRRPELHFYGIAGPQMEAAGVAQLIDSREMAVVGLFEVLAHFPTVYGALRAMRRRLREDRPDLLLLVDYPDFNLRLARTAKELGVPVLYYISPQVWAWRQHRVHEIGERVDQMAVIFPFEVPFYRKADVPVRFVGHPLVNEVYSDLTTEEARSALGLHAGRPTVGLFPGSRRSEIRRLLPLLLEAGARLQADRPEVQFVLPRAATLDAAELAPYLDRSTLAVHQVSAPFYDVIRACDVVATASGTAALEVALMGVPLVVVYRMNPLTFRIMRRMVRLDHVSLCNIVAGRQVAPSCSNVTRLPRTAELAGPLDDPALAASARAALAPVRGRLGGNGGAANAAQLLLEMLGLKGEG